MDQHRRLKRIVSLFVIAALIALVLVDRYSWSQIAQWREDQATNLWLGYTAGIGNIPVGLISSRYIPNPNGMILLGAVLSLLPDLLSISIFLGLLQAFFLILVGLKASEGSWQYFALAAFPALSSVILRSSSVEFWNQYIITLVNIFFIFWALRYLETSSLWNLPPMIALIVIAPSLYLAGAVNAIVMFLITLGLLAYKRPAHGHIWAVTGVSLAILLVSAFLTWHPYFPTVSLVQLAEINKNHFGVSVVER